MASGHVNRTIRPNTWPQPTKAQYVQKVLANREPSTHGTTRTCRIAPLTSAHRRVADISKSAPQRAALHYAPGASRASKFRTVLGCHAPPRALRTPLALSAVAMPSSVAIPRA